MTLELLTSCLLLLLRDRNTGVCHQAQAPILYLACFTYPSAHCCQPICGEWQLFIVSWVISSACFHGIFATSLVNNPKQKQEWPTLWYQVLLRQDGLGTSKDIWPLIWASLKMPRGKQSSDPRRPCLFPQFTSINSPPSALAISQCTSGIQ